MVDVRLEAVGVDNVICKDYYASLRIGETQKLSRIAGARDYRFQKDASDRKTGKLDVFKRVGSSCINVKNAPDAGPQEVEVACGDDGAKFKFRLAFKHDGDDKQLEPVVEKPPAKQLGQTLLEAKKYVEEHNLEMRLAEAMQAVLREKPANPGQLIATMLTQSERPEATGKPAAGAGTVPEQAVLSTAASAMDTSSAFPPNPNFEKLPSTGPTMRPPRRQPASPTSGIGLGAAEPQVPSEVPQLQPSTPDPALMPEEVAQKSCESGGEGNAQRPFAEGHAERSLTLLPMQALYGLAFASSGLRPNFIVR